MTEEAKQKSNKLPVAVAARKLKLRVMLQMPLEMALEYAVPDARLRVVITFLPALVISALGWLALGGHIPFMVFLMWIVSLKPGTEFLREEVVFTAAILTIATPLVLEMLSRISERYNSDVVAANFRAKAKTSLAFPVMLANVVVAVSWQFFGWSSCWLWTQLVAWFVFVSFLYAGWWLLSFLFLLLNHTNPDYLLESLFQEAEDCIDD